MCSLFGRQSTLGTTAPKSHAGKWDNRTRPVQRWLALKYQAMSKSDPPGNRQTAADISSEWVAGNGSEQVAGLKSEYVAG